MKRELANVMEPQTQLNESLGRTQGSISIADKERSDEPDLHSNIAIADDNSNGADVRVYKRCKNSIDDAFAANFDGGKLDSGDGFEGDQSEGQVTVSRKANDVEAEVREMEMTEVEFGLESTGRPTTVRELLETGLLGYPVFYNGGKKGVLLRDTIEDCGILCSCILCKGVTVFPPCKFEIHACRSYRRATQYICLENGKSLLDVVKECKKSSIEALEEAIQTIIGPLPVKESMICQSCKRLFLATYAAKMDQLCDSCMISMKSVDSRMHTPRERIRKSEPVMGVKPSESAEVLTAPPSR